MDKFPRMYISQPFPILFTNIERKYYKTPLNLHKLTGKFREVLFNNAILMPIFIITYVTQSDIIGSMSCKRRK